MAHAIWSFSDRNSRPTVVIAIPCTAVSIPGKEDLSIRFLSAQRFFTGADSRFLPAAVGRPPRRAVEPLPFPVALFCGLADELHCLSTAIARPSRSLSFSSSATIGCFMLLTRSLCKAGYPARLRSWGFRTVASSKGCSTCRAIFSRLPGDLKTPASLWRLSAVR